ncbi:MAG: alpha-1,2-fucosyltransferase [Methanobrevibacter sp.]|jgi:hypothetical protein|nr:alpha-1,2-fucosyltransferase [Candidatus Methanoflexus mossambicus]
MITVKIKGGLGNQLFQYSAARSLAYDMKTDLYLDLSWFDNYPNAPEHVKYLLNDFNIELSGFVGSYSWKLKKKINKIKKSSETQFKDYDAHNEYYDYNEKIITLKDNIFLDGYWQDERYFLNNQEKIKENLEITTKPTKKNKILLKEIDSNNSIALTVRRGDYLTPSRKAQFGFCTLDYYNKAAEIIAKKVDNPIFYIFSDDPDWVEKNIKLNYPTNYISHNNKAKKYYEDLRLISHCKHHIMANSTFSWWGSWLSENPSKIAIGPEPWFNRYTMPHIMPKNWVRLKCDRSEIFNGAKNSIYKVKDIKINENETKEINSSAILPENQNDNIMKLTLLSEKKGILKIHFEKMNPIAIGYGKKISERYIYLDKEISLDNLKISNIGKSQLIINDLEIKNFE